MRCLIYVTMFVLLVSLTVRLMLLDLSSCVVFSGGGAGDVGLLVFERACSCFWIVPTVFPSSSLFIFSFSYFFRGNRLLPTILNFITQTVQLMFVGKVSLTLVHRLALLVLLQIK